MRKLKVEHVLAYFQETPMAEAEPMLRLITKAVAARRPLLKATTVIKRMRGPRKVKPAVLAPINLSNSAD